MSITKSQIEQFRANPFPDTVFFNSQAIDLAIKKGNEALVVKVGDQAFKWYAKLSGQNIKGLLKYADGVNQDEIMLRQVGLSTEQLPDSRFFISSTAEKTPQLYAIQPWIEGRLLKDLTLEEILKNHPLRQSLRSLFLISHDFYKQTGRFPDLKGSEKIFGIMSDPTKIIWPFRSTNIIVSGNTAVLTDARTLNPSPGSIKSGASKVHQAITLLAVRTILSP